MDEEKLINLVQKYACLYDVSSRCYSDKLMKGNAWEEISTQINAPGKILNFISKDDNLQ